MGDEVIDTHCQIPDPLLKQYPDEGLIKPLINKRNLGTSSSVKEPEV
jgi:hypothetical protein